ncbi:hypothetical protein KCG43_17940 [Photobacterium sp. WH24]|uniref:IS1 family transposase n=1 Tax=Photobacterium arenosum TaxID=2774143 RepID=A0ABR9BJ41_9GAMM|nr:hypothetical protein [Photobacterium arenosum]MBV7263894.1 hypothetical protein [Photobacterium sp. WH24]
MCPHCKSKSVPLRIRRTMLDKIINKNSHKFQCSRCSKHYFIKLGSYVGAATTNR